MSRPNPHKGERSHTPTRGQTPPRGQTPTRGRSGSTDRQKDSSRHMLGGRPLEDFQKASQKKTRKPSNERQTTQENQASHGNSPRGSRNNTRGNSRSPGRDKGDKGEFTRKPTQAQVYGKSPEVIAQQARSQLVTQRKKRTKADKSLADTGNKHPKLLVVQKKNVVSVTSEQEYEFRDDPKLLDSHLAKQSILQDAYFQKHEGNQLTAEELNKQTMDPNEIHKIYKKNRAWKLHDEMKKPRHYLDKVTKNIPLDELYSVLDYYYNSKDQEICPVLLEIKDKQLRNAENGLTEEQAKARKTQALSVAFDAAGEDAEGITPDERTKVPPLEMNKVQDGDEKRISAPDKGMLNPPGMLSPGRPQTSTPGETLGQDKLLDGVSPEENDFKYLLQVWTKTGRLIYERKLKKVLKGWGLCGDKFFYQEDDTEDNIFEIFMLSTAGPKVKIFKFILPEVIKRVQSDDRSLMGIIQPGLEMSQVKREQFWTKVQHHLDDSASDAACEMKDLMNESRKFLQNPYDSKVLPSHAVQDPDDSIDFKTGYRPVPDKFKDACERQTEKIRERNRNYVRRNLSYVDGRIIMATKYALIELKINKLLELDDPANITQKVQVETSKDEDNMEAEVYADDHEKLIMKLNDCHIKKVAIYGQYLFERFIDIGDDRSAMVLENETTNQVRFILLTTQDSSNKAGRHSKDRSGLKAEDKHKICYKILGIHQKQPKTHLYGSSPILKIVSSTFALSNDDCNSMKPRTKSAQMGDIRKAGQNDAIEEQAEEEDDDNKEDQSISVVNKELEERKDGTLPPISGATNKGAEEDVFAIDESKRQTPGDKEKDAKPESTKDSSKIKDSKKSRSKLSTVTLILRESGKVEVYSDFELSETFNLAFNNKHQICVDITADDTNFYLKFLNLSKKALNGDLDRPQYEVRQIQQAWRRRITYKNTVKTFDDWKTLRLKNLNKFMKLYSSFETFQGHILVAHRGYISLYNLKDATKEDQRSDEPGQWWFKKKPKSCWAQHLDLAPHNYVRELFLINNNKKYLEYQTEHLRCHSKPLQRLEQTFVFGALLGKNEVRKFQLKDNCLEEIESYTETARQKQFKLQLKGKYIIDALDEQKYLTGALLRVVCGKCDTSHVPLEEGDDDPSVRTLFKKRNLFSGEAHDTKQGTDAELEEHQVFEARIHRARDRCQHGNCLQIFNLNYEELTELYDAKKVSKDKRIDPKATMKVVRTNKSLWRDQIPYSDSGECSVISKIYDFDNHDPYMDAVLFYKKNNYIRLIPYFGAETLVDKTISQTVDVPNHLAKQMNTKQTLLVNVKQTLLRMALYHEHTFELLDKYQTTAMLGDQDLLLFRSVYKKQETADMRENAYVCVTPNQISAVSDEGHEIGRITGLEISQAIVLDTNYLYVTQNSVCQLYEQYASFDSDWLLSEAEEITRLEKAADTFTHINFATIFSGHYTEIHVTGAALGVNGYLLRNYTTDVVAVMQNIHSMKIMPVPHWNIMSFNGMQSKSNYLIWKESSDGFFTALSKSGSIYTWSRVTGELLYKEKQTYDDDCHVDNIENYEIYRSDQADLTYTQNGYTFNSATKPDESFAITLLVSRFPVHKERTLSNIEEAVARGQFDAKLDPEDLIGEVNQEEIQMRIEEKTRSYHKQLRNAVLANTASDFIGFDDEDIPNEMFQREEMQWQNKPGRRRAITKKLRRSKLYHFQVIKLRQYEDNLRSMRAEHKKDGQRIRPKGSSCVLVYHFFHKLLNRFDSVEGFENYDWFLNEHNLKQRLYLSSDANRMLEVIQNKVAVVWNQPYEGLDREDGALINWQMAYEIEKFPFLAAQVCSIPYFISDDFGYLCMYDYRNRRMRIHHAKDNTLIADLPQGCIHKTDSHDERKNVRDAYSCVAITGRGDSEKIITYNKVSGDWTEFSVTKNVCYYQDTEPSQTVYQYTVDNVNAKSYVMRNIEQNITTTNMSLIKQPMQDLKKTATLQRLMQHAMRYQLHHDKRCDLDEKEDMYYPDCYSPLLQIDYTQDIEQPMQSFGIDRTFSWIDWRQAELVCTHKDVSSLLDEEQLRLYMSIFPNGSSFLEMLMKHDESKAKVIKTVEPLANLEHAFNGARGGLDCVYNFSRETINLEIPMFANMYGLIPLDYSCGISDHVIPKHLSHPKTMNRRFKPLKDHAIQVSQSENAQLTKAIFANMGQYQFLHTSHRIDQNIVYAVGEGLPQVIDYLDNRIQKNHFIARSLNTKIEHSCKQTTPAWGDYGVTNTSNLSDSNFVQDQLFTQLKGENLKKGHLYEYYWFDVPRIYYPSKEGYNFMNALQQVEDINIFSHPSVQILIQNHWSHWEPKKRWFINVPLFLLVLTFSVQACVLMPNYHNVNERILQISEIVQTVLAAYWLILNLISCLSLCKGGLRSRSTAVIALSIATPVMIILCQVMAYMADREEGLGRWYWEAISWTAFLLWVLVLNMLGSIETFSGTIRMVLTSFKVMFSYMVVVVIGVLCFTNVFQSVRQILYEKTASLTDGRIEPPYDKNQEVETFWDWKDKWLGEYIEIWREIFVGAVIGLELDNAKGFSDSQMLLFLLSVVFNTIVLMNLLLAVVGTVQGEVDGAKGQYFHRMLVDQICTLQRIFFAPQRSNNTMMFLAKAKGEGTDDQIDGQDLDQDQLFAKLDSLSRTMKELSQKVDGFEHEKDEQEKYDLLMTLLDLQKKDAVFRELSLAPTFSKQRSNEQRSRRPPALAKRSSSRQ